MQATLTFNLPEEEPEYTMAVRGKEFYFALLQVRDNLRALVKYPEAARMSSDEQSLDQHTLDVVESMFWNVLTEHTITLDEIP